MKHIPPHLLDPARYPFAVEISTRFADIDTSGHINNVALASAFEDARVRFDTQAGLRATPGRTMMIAAAYIDYLAQAFYPQPLKVMVGVVEVGRASWKLSQLALQGDQPRAICQAVMVGTDGVRAQRIGDDVRALLEAAMVRSGS